MCAVCTASTASLTHTPDRHTPDKHDTKNRRKKKNKWFHSTPCSLTARARRISNNSQAANSMLNDAKWNAGRVRSTRASAWRELRYSAHWTEHTNKKQFIILPRHYLCSCVFSVRRCLLRSLFFFCFTAFEVHGYAFEPCVDGMSGRKKIKCTSIKRSLVQCTVVTKP